MMLEECRAPAEWRGKEVCYKNAIMVYEELEYP